MKVQTEKWLIDLEPKVVYVDDSAPPSVLALAVLADVEAQVAEFRRLMRLGARPGKSS